MAQWFGFDNLGELSITSNSTLELADSYLRLGGQAYQTGVLVLDTSVSGVGGLDLGAVQPSTAYRIYVVLDAGVPKIIGSIDETSPLGFLVFSKVGVFTTDDLSNISFVGSEAEFAKEVLNNLDVRPETLNAYSIVGQASHGYSWGDHTLASSRGNIAGYTTPDDQDFFLPAGDYRVEFSIQMNNGAAGGNRSGGRVINNTSGDIIGGCSGGEGTGTANTPYSAAGAGIITVLTGESISLQFRSMVSGRGSTTNAWSGWSASMTITPIKI